MPKLSDEQITRIRKRLDKGDSPVAIAKEEHLPYTTVYDYKHGLKKRSKGYRKESAMKLGYTSYISYLNALARKRGFGSHNGYEESLSKKRMERLPNIIFGELVKNTLERTGNNTYWLGFKAKVSEMAIRSYIDGKYLPRDEIISRISDVLDIGIKSRNDLASLCFPNLARENVYHNLTPARRDYLQTAILSKCYKHRGSAIGMNGKFEVYNCIIHAERRNSKIKRKICGNTASDKKRLEHFVKNHLNPYLFS